MFGRVAASSPSVLRVLSTSVQRLTLRGSIRLCSSMMNQQPLRPHSTAVSNATVASAVAASKPTAAYSKGLSGVIAGQTAISTVGESGFGLMYRGYTITDLCASCCYEEIAYLLIYGELPTSVQLAEYKHHLASYRELPPKLLKSIELIPKTVHPMNVMNILCNLYGAHYVEKFNDEKNPVVSENVRECADRLIAAMGPMLLYWYHYAFHGKRIETKTDASDTIALNFIKLLHNKPKERPNPLLVKTVDTSLILYAEHGFAASTFAARVTASTNSDFYSCASAAIGTLRGNLHGGANEAAMYLIQQFQNKEEVEAKLRKMLSEKKLIMGFGHRIYRNGDPRSNIIKSCSYQLSQLPNNSEGKKLYDISCVVEEFMMREKKLHPNLDFFAASAYHQCGVPTDFFTPIFVIARMAGWASHVLEQRADNKLFRPSALYTGPKMKAFVKIEDRALQRSKL